MRERAKPMVAPRVRASVGAVVCRGRPQVEPQPRVAGFLILMTNAMLDESSCSLGFEHEPAREQRQDSQGNFRNDDHM